jgi:D-amino-acid dehydrogenase
VSHAVVIGGGVIGVASAYYLSKSGWRVTLLDRGRIGGGCSHANCGLVCPSHVLPLAAPGAIRGALAALLHRNSPFSIKPRLDPALWSWLFRFARRCNARDMLTAGRACQALLDSSMSLYQRLLQDEAMECEWERRGLLFVYGTQAEFDRFARTNDLLSEHFQSPARRIAAAELCSFEPALKPDLAGGYYYEHDAQLRPDRLLSEWRRVLEARGVDVIENCDFRGFDVNNGRALRAITSSSDVEADAFVVATGAWTPQLARHLGCRVPIQPGKGYSLTMPRPAVCPRVPLILVEHHVAVTPMQSGYRLGSTMEFAGYDSSIDPRRLDLLRKGAAACLREPYTEPIEEAWYGWRPMTYDSVPIIDRSPRWGNLFIAAGHNMLGLSMAPATGKLIAELVTGQPTHIDSSRYKLARFGAT